MFGLVFASIGVFDLFCKGATLVPFTIPCFDQMRLSHTITIVSEMGACMEPLKGETHNLVKKKKVLNAVFRVTFLEDGLDQFGSHAVDHLLRCR